MCKGFRQISVTPVVALFLCGFEADCAVTRADSGPLHPRPATDFLIRTAMAPSADENSYMNIQIDEIGTPPNKGRQGLRLAG